MPHCTLVLLSGYILYIVFITTLDSCLDGDSWANTSFPCPCGKKHSGNWTGNGTGFHVWFRLSCWCSRRPCFSRERTDASSKAGHELTWLPWWMKLLFCCSPHSTSHTSFEWILVHQGGVMWCKCAVFSLPFVLPPPFQPRCSRKESLSQMFLNW